VKVGIVVVVVVDEVVVVLDVVVAAIVVVVAGASSGSIAATLSPGAQDASSVAHTTASAMRIRGRNTAGWYPGNGEIGTHGRAGPHRPYR
jgi:hypothetical protein